MGKGVEMVQVILISGKMGSGKTTLQKALAVHFLSQPNTGAGLINFADVLYEMHDAVLGVLHKYMDKRPIVKDGPLLQLLGTEWGRKTLGENCWVEILQARVNHLKLQVPVDRNYYLIVGDCRFENEFNAFPDALRVRLYCPEDTRRERCSMWRPNDAHPSETGLDDFYLKDKFDLVINTQVLNAERTVDRVVDALATDFYRRRKK
jgi:hypothetical protein